VAVLVGSLIALLIYVGLDIVEEFLMRLAINR
jgi:hypothetical protein